MTLERNYKNHDDFQTQNVLTNDNFRYFASPSDSECIGALLLVNIDLPSIFLNAVQITHARQGVSGQSQGGPFSYNQNIRSVQR